MKNTLPAYLGLEIHKSFYHLFRHTPALSNSTGRFRTLILFVSFFLLAASQFSAAQETLVGLTSNGGPEGKGTAFSIKTNGTDFTITKGFADWGKNPTGGLVQGPD